MSDNSVLVGMSGGVDSSVAAYQHVTAAAVSYQRRRYAKILQEISKQLQK